MISPPLICHCWRRWSAPPAVLLGLLLGASLYCYQLSWFVPLLAVASAASLEEVWKRAGALRLAVITAAAATVVALPGLFMVEGLRAVTDQTFDRAVWNRIDPGAERAALVVLPRDVDAAGVASAIALLGERRVVATTERSSAQRQILTVSASAAALDAGAALAADRGWDLVRDPWQEDSAAGRLAAAIAQLFTGPVAESAGRWIDAPLLNPLLAPLAVLGLVEAFRRRREPFARVLLVWVTLAALLPAVLGGVVPRRTVLALPLVYAAMALPLLAIGAALAARKGAAARFGWAGAVVLWLGVAATGCHSYFERWDQRIGVPSHDRGVLAFLELVDSLPPDEVILFPSFYSQNQQALLRERGNPDAPVFILAATAVSAADVRAASCRQATPFSWLTLDEPAHTARFAALGDDFLYRKEIRGGFALYRVSLRIVGGCREPVGRGRYLKQQHGVRRGGQAQGR